MPRLFIAIRPPPSIMDALIDTMEAVKNARWQDEDQLHLTLRFIGEVEDRLAEDIAHALGAVSFEPFDVAIAGTGHFQRKGLVHSIWAGVQPSAGLQALHQRIARCCTALGLAPERRKYSPHITLARFSRHSADIPAWLARHGGLRLPPWRAESFSLIESHLSHGPALYQEIASYPR